MPEAERSPEISRSQVSFKTVFTVCFGGLIVAGVVYGLANSLVAIALTGAALLIAVSLDHVVGMLQRRGLSRPAAIAVVMLGVIGVVVAFGFTLIPPAVDQGKQLIKDAPSFVRRMRESAFFGRVDLRFHVTEQLAHLERAIPSMLEGAASPVVAAVGGLVTAVAAAITITFLVVFMLIFGGRLVENALGEARAERRPIYEDVLHEIYKSIGGYLGGLLLICLINATLTTTFLAIDSVPFFLPLGIIAGLSSLVPYAGPFIMGTLISLVALATRGMWHGVAAAIYFVVYGQLEGNILGPLVFRRTVHVNPLVVTLSILFCGEMAGILGAIVAVPVVAALQIVLRELLRIRREQLRMPPPPKGT